MASEKFSTTNDLSIMKHHTDFVPLSMRSIRNVSNKHIEIVLPPKNYFVTTPNFLLQSRGLIYQRIIIQKRKYFSTLCQIFAPLFLILVIYLLQLLTVSILGNKDLIIPSRDILPIPIKLNFNVPCDMDPASYRPENCTNDFRILRSIINNPKHCVFLLNLLREVNPIFFSRNPIDCSNPKRLYQLSPQYYLFELPFYFFTSEDFGNVYGSLSHDGIKYGFLGSFIKNQYRFSLRFDVNPKFDDPFYNSHTIYSNCSVNNLNLPFFINLNTTSSDQSFFHIYDHIINIKYLNDKNENIFKRYFIKFKTSPSSQYHYSLTLTNVKRKKFELSLPYSALHINKLNVSFLDVQIISPEFQLSITKHETYRGNILLNQICNSFFSTLSNLTDTSHINTWIFPIPENGNSLCINLFDFAGNLVFPLLSSLLFPLYIDFFVQEREGGHWIMMKLSTLSEFSYLVISFIYFFSLYFVSLFPAYLASLALKLRVITHSSFILLFIIYGIWGCSQIIMAFFFSIFFNRARFATTFSYVVIILGIIVSFIIFSLFPDSVAYNFISMFYPPFSFYRVLYLLNINCQQYHCFQLDVLTSWNAIVQYLFSLSIGSLLFLIFSLYLLKVFSNTNGNRIYSLLCFYLLYRFFKFFTFSYLSIFRRLINYEFIHEKSGINQFSFKESLINIDHLRKVYKAGKISHIAVKGFTLQIRSNECFGLLGLNGAGKTTLISMLTGIVTPSSGTVLINSNSFTSNASKIYEDMGYCPQFNILYPELTCSEHILFYSRLKCVRIKQEKKLLDIILNISELIDVSHTKTKFLSGGLKRRLAVAISIINNPSILILDEPTAGLDPLSRCQLWDLITSIRKNRSIIISTHNMEEADKLCTKVGILHFGVLRALGPQILLKNVYTDGYQIKINSNPNYIPEIKDYIGLNFPYTIFLSLNDDFLLFKIPYEYINAISVLTFLANLAKSNQIYGWEIIQPNLEDVLLNVAHHVMDKRNEVQKSLLLC